MTKCQVMYMPYKHVYNVTAQQRVANHKQNDQLKSEIIRFLWAIKDLPFPLIVQRKALLHKSIRDKFTVIEGGLNGDKDL